MANPGQLPEEYRSHLDKIVDQLEAEGLPEDEIKATVADYKSRYTLPAMLKVSPPKALQGPPSNPTSLKDIFSSMANSDVEEAQTAGPANAAVGSVVAPMMLGGAVTEIPAVASALGAAKPAGAAALRGLLYGTLGGTADALHGGDHPIRTGLEVAAGSAALEVPGVGKILRAVLPNKLKLLFDMVSKNKAEAPAWEPFRGTPAPKAPLFQPDYSPPAKVVAPNKAKELLEKAADNWKANKPTLKAKSASGPNLGENYSQATAKAPGKQEVESVQDYIKKKIKGQI